MPIQDGQYSNYCESNAADMTEKVEEVSYLGIWTGEEILDAAGVGSSISSQRNF